MAARPIILDCDPGQDDAVAIMLALASPEEIDVKGITAVAGNVPLTKTERNARMLVELAGRVEIPVFAGCPRPIMREQVTGEAVHGQEGIDGIEIVRPKKPREPMHGVDFLIEALLNSPSEGMTVVAIGPLTNVAVALIKSPEIAGHIRELVIMGGAGRALGNRTPTAEFNFLADPHAAKIVLDCGRPITMMSLDVTHQAITRPDRLERIRGLGNPVADAAAGMLGFYHTDRPERYGEVGMPLHDPLTIAYLIAPDLFKGREVNVEVDCLSELSMGSSRVDFWGVTGKPANVQWMETLDADRFYGLLTERLARYGTD